MTLIVMALARNKLACRLALLVLKFGLLTLNPGQPGDSKEAHSLVVDPQWRSHTYPSSWWVDSEMQVFDVFAYYINDEAVNGDLVFLLSTHPDSLLSQR